jgi:hypothetical protein
VVIRKGRAFHSWRRGELSESFRWLFVDDVPLLYSKKRVARQFQVEIWLDPSPIIKELKIKNMKTSKRDPNPALRYIV